MNYSIMIDFKEVSAITIADILNKAEKDFESLSAIEMDIYNHVSQLQFSALCVLPVLDHIYADTELKRLLKTHPYFDKALMHINHGKIPTPLKNAYQARIDAINSDVRYSDVTELAKGDYAAIQPRNGVTYTGFVKSIGTKNIVIESPYGGHGGGDYLQIQELKFEKKYLKAFCKPRK